MIYRLLRLLLGLWPWVIASTLTAQDLSHYRLDLSLQQVTLREAFREIEAQTGLRFMYRSDLLPDDRVSLQRRQAPLPEVLDALLSPYGLAAAQRGSQLVIRRAAISAPAPPPPPAREPARLKGYIRAGDTGQGLPGATLWVAGAQRGTYAGPAGAFRVWLPPGTHQVSVRYFGYEPLQLTLDLPAGGRLDTALVLLPRALALQYVLISANLEGQQRALSEQRIATQVQHVISAELISRFPDLNVADALQRMPGVQVGRARGEGSSVQVRGTPRDFTLVQLEGETLLGAHEQGDRGVDLDVIPVDQLATIELNKTLLPAMDGDAIAGLINLRLPQAGSLRPSLKAELGGGYTAQAQGLSGIGKLLYKQRFLPSPRQAAGRLGVVAGGSYYHVQNGRHRIEVDWQERDPTSAADFSEPAAAQQIAGTEPVFVGNEYILRRLQNQRYRMGGLLGLDWTQGEHRWYVQGLFSRRQDVDLRQRLRYRPGRGQWVTPFLSTRAEVRRDLNERQSAKESYAFMAGGQHQWGRLGLRYQGFGATTARDYQARRTLFRDSGHTLLFTPDPSGRWEMRSPGRDLHSEDLFYELRDITDDEIRTWSRHQAWRLDLDWRPTGYWQIQAGFKYRWLAQGQHRDNRFYDYAGPDTSMWAFATAGAEPPFFQPPLRIGRFPDPVPVNAFFEAYRNDSAFFHFKPGVQRLVSDPVARSGTEHTLASYAQVQYHQGPWLLLAGLRQETVQAHYGGNRVETDSTGAWLRTSPQVDSSQYRQWLPHLHLRYQWTLGWLLRAAFYQSYARPNFLDLTPYQEIFLEAQEVRLGNPGLRPARATHLECQVEHYWGNTGVAGLSVFGKQVRDYLLPVQQWLPAAYFVPGESGSLRVLRSENGGQAYLLGLEIYGYLPLPWLPEAAGQFGLYGNYTLAQGAAWQGGERTPFPLQASHTGNLALTYDRQRLALRVNLNYTGAFLLASGTQPQTDVGRAPRHQLDLNASYRLGSRLSIFVEGINLTDSPQIDYLGVRSRPREIEYYGWRGRLGLAWTW